MGLPKGYRKNLNITPQNVGAQRRQDILDNITRHGTYLPKSVLYEDLDSAFVEFVDKQIDLEIAGKRYQLFF